MKEFFKMMFATITGIFVSFILFSIFMFLFIVIIAIIFEPKSESIPKNSVLHLTFGEEIKDKPNSNPFENVSFLNTDIEKSYSLRNVLKTLHYAKNDEKIKGIYLDLKFVPTEITNLEEIRDALIDFKNSGKFIYAYSTFYNLRSYYLASIADSIFLNPFGEIDFKGLYANVAYFKGLFEKLEIEPVIVRHGKFKSAVEPFMQKTMSPENKEQIEVFLNSVWNYYINELSKTRKIETTELNRLADELLLFNANNTLKFKLVDKLSYPNEMIDMLKAKLDIGEKEKIDLIPLKKYMGYVKEKSNENSGDKIAIIYAQGNIVGGSGTGDFVAGDTYVKLIRQIRKDDDIKAVVLRVNSPGGDGNASEDINREIELLKKEKPVVSSFGNYAASGGYYIACNSNKIVADHLTLTGSIGVFGLMFNAKDLFANKLGINFEVVKTNKFSDYGSGLRPYNDYEIKMIQLTVDAFYDTFLTRVATGRNLSKEKVDEIGQGRIWNAIDAKKLGLVDTLGGLELSLNIAADLAKLKEYSVETYPAKENFIEKIFEMFSDDVDAFVLKKKLGDNYKYIEKIDQILNMNKIQARLINEVEIK